MLFSAQANASGNYDEALEKTKEAVYKQTGLEAHVEKAQQYGQKEAERYAEDIGLNKEVVGTLGFIGKALYNKRVVIKYKNTRLELEQKQVKLMFTWTF